jgi:hypothetical protein
MPRKPEVRNKIATALRNASRPLTTHELAVIAGCSHQQAWNVVSKQLGDEFARIGKNDNGGSLYQWVGNGHRAHHVDPPALAEGFADGFRLVGLVFENDNGRNLIVRVNS